ncbi:hypothetical protein C7B69_01685 [filamentous cyanobacterium Phorm 46]|nr:hypothetical protein C7B69_01685 [filamentous cyanobacterium Phorm 46]
MKKLIDVDIKMNEKIYSIAQIKRNSIMSAFETFLTFGFASVFAVATLATWLRFTYPPSVKRN